MLNPVIIFLEDPTTEASRSLLLTCAIDAHLNLDMWGGVAQEEQEEVHVAIQSIEMFSLNHSKGKSRGRTY
jgi:hypothetical protein